MLLIFGLICLTTSLKAQTREETIAGLTQKIIACGNNDNTYFKCSFSVKNNNIIMTRRSIDDGGIYMYSLSFDAITEASVGTSAILLYTDGYKAKFVSYTGIHQIEYFSKDDHYLQIDMDTSVEIDLKNRMSKAFSRLIELNNQVKPKETF